MYNFELLNSEETISIFDDIFIKQGDNEKETTIILTNQRLLFLDYLADDPDEILRIGRGVQYIRAKQIYYQCDLKAIEKVFLDKLYTVNLKNNISFQFENEELYKLLKENTK